MFQKVLFEDEGPKPGSIKKNEHYWYYNNLILVVNLGIYTCRNFGVVLYEHKSFFKP